MIDDYAKVCVGVPCYNNESTIEETLNSLLNQTYKNIRIIVIDNCSTDNSVRIIKKIIGENDSKKIQLIENDCNIGGAKNWNKCIDCSDGEFFCLYHSDDVYMPNIIEKEVEFLSNNPDMMMVFTESYLIGAKGEIRGETTIPESYAVNGLCGADDLIDCLLTHGNIMMCPSVMFRRTVLDDNKFRFSTNIRYAFDLALYISIGKEYRIGFIKEKLIKYRLFNVNSASYRVILHYKNMVYDDFISILQNEILLLDRKELLQGRRFVNIYNNYIKTKMINAWLNGDFEYAKNMIEKFNYRYAPKHLELWKILINMPLPVAIRKIVAYKRYKKFFKNHFSDIHFSIEE